jgi:hypothetical protein
MGIFGWSLPPGCGTLPGEEDEQPIDLREGKTLKGYGRRDHGLNGKDADLDYGGQLVVKQAWWFEDGKITIDASGYAAIVPREYPEDGETQEHFDRYMDMATEVVCGGPGYSGEWDGDYWVFSNPFSLTLQLDWDDSLTDEENIDAALALAYDALEKANAEFEREMTQLAKDINALSPDEPRKPWGRWYGRKRHGKQSRRAAFASYCKRRREWLAELRT